MQAIAKDVYIEDRFPGVTLGAVSLAHGLIQIDSPPSPEDGRAWRASLLDINNSAERLLVNLDAHPDRTLGVRVMECPVVAHEKAAAVFRSRPSTFKGQGDETGSDWESISGIGNVRWVLPELTFDHEMSIHWGDILVRIEHHPGPSVGASWVVLPEAQVVFVGDAVLRGLPPFLSGANIPEWLETLTLLASSEFKNWRVVSGRGGLVTPDHLRAQTAFLKLVLGKVEKLAKKKVTHESLEDLARSLMGEFKIPANRQHKFSQRLRYGLYHYFVRHYQPLGKVTSEE